MASRLISRVSIRASDLVKAHTPNISSKNKIALHQFATYDWQPRGTVVASRWREKKRPQTMPQNSPTKFEASPTPFSYPASNDKTVHWHLNFTLPELFQTHGSRLFTQSEIQVAEHPALGSLREYLVDEKRLDFQPLTIDNEIRETTPILISGVERRLSIDIETGTKAKPDGLYGPDFFDEVEEDEVINSATVLSEPVLSNIIAMAAPVFGLGDYTFSQIKYIFITAYTAFSAANEESKLLTGKEDTKAIIHTGYWGCGATGNNKELMTVLQLMAAKCAEVDTLSFHCLPFRETLNEYEKGKELFESLQSQETVLDMLHEVARLGFSFEFLPTIDLPSKESIQHLLHLNRK